MSFSFKAVAYGLASIFGLGGVLLHVIGATQNNAAATSSGWTLVGISFVMWLISLVVRKL